MTFSPTFGRVFSPTFKPNSLAVVAAVAGFTNFFNQLYAGWRNDFDGGVGFEFVPTEDIVIVALGRAISTSMLADHRVSLWQVVNQPLIADVTVTPTSSVDALGYAYEMLASPVTLTSGTFYRIVSQEGAMTDPWTDLQEISNHLTTASIIKGVYKPGSFAYPNEIYGSSEMGYVPPTFYT